MPGSCEGGTVSVEVVEREGDCLERCKVVDGCDWFTFDDSDGACILLTACTQIDSDECDTCWSGQRQCGERKGNWHSMHITLCKRALIFLTDFTKIMVVGGFSDDLASELNNVEVLDLDSDNSGCDSIANYPMPTDSMVGVVMDGAPFLCGGFVPEIGDGTDECYTYNYETLSWDASRNKMTMPRYYHRASLVDSATWLITGGRDAAGVYFDSTEIYQDGAFTQGPTLPSERDCHCQVTLNSSYVAILGGYNGVEYDQTFYLLDWATQGYESMPDAPFPFCNDGCGLIDNSDNGQELVFFNENDCQIFNFASNDWRDGPAIPSDVTYESMTVQMLKDFYVMGGRRPDDSSTDSVYRFDAENYQWIREGVTLQTPRRKGVGLAVPDNVVNCS